MSDDRDKKALVSAEDILGASRPATKLLEVISNATGVLYEPTRIRRKAKAERDAQLIAAETRVEITEIERRGLERLVREEGRKQQNVESIIEKAIPEINNNSNPEDVDPDWFMYFVDNAKKISNEEVQNVWSRILSGEVNSPRSFSKRTLSTLGNLSQNEAKIFESVCRFFVIGLNHPVIFNDEEIYTKCGLNYIALKSLEEAGLIEFNSITGFQANISPDGDGERIVLGYFDTIIILNSVKSLQIGQVRLAVSGQELQPIVHVASVDGFVSHIVEKWREHGTEIVARK